MPLDLQDAVGQAYELLRKERYLYLMCDYKNSCVYVNMCVCVSVCLSVCVFVYLCVSISRKFGAHLSDFLLQKIGEPLGPWPLYFHRLR